MELKSGFKETEVGPLPRSWSVRGLLDAVKVANGQVDPRAEPYKSMTLVAPDHIESRTGRLLALRTASQQGAISGKYLFDRGDIVYSKIRPYLRKAILADFSGLCSADMYPLKPVDGTSSGFVLATLLGERFSRFAESVSVRSGMPKINRDELAEFRIALPPPEEQQAIATALSDVDALLGALDRLIAKKRDLKQAAMHQLLTGKTRLPGFAGAQSWRRAQLGALFDFRNGVNADKSAYGSGIRFINVLEVITRSHLAAHDVPGRIGLPRAEHDAYLVRRGDILFNRTSETLDEVGLAAVYADDEPVVFGGFVIRARPRPDAGLDSRFCGYALRDPAIRQQIVSRGQGAIRANIGQADLRKVEMRCPPVGEQAAIATVLSDMDAEIAAIEARRDKTRLLKQGMMQELLTGRTRLV